MDEAESQAFRSHRINSRLLLSRAVDTTLHISPPNLLPWLSRKQKENSIILLDLEADSKRSNTLNFHLNIVFNPISIRRGHLTRADFYIGSTGGEIVVDIANGIITDYTNSQTLNVNYSNTTTRRQTSALCLAPSLQSRENGAEFELKAGSVTFDVNSERTLSASFSGSERFLVAMLMDNTLKWVISLPRGEQVVRDFLIGNLYLHAECAWRGECRKGRIAVRPSDVRFFDADRRPLGPKHSLLMQFALWRKGIRVLNKDGFELNFTDKPS